MLLLIWLILVYHLWQVPAAAAASVSKKAGILGRMGSGTFQSSTKIEALREEIRRMLQRDPSAKAIVFSQFTSMLDLVHHRLQQVKYANFLSCLP